MSNVRSRREQASALWRNLAKISENFSVEINLTLILPNKVDTCTALAEDYLDDFRDEYPDAIAPESIPQSQDIRNAAESGQTAFALEEPSTIRRPCPISVSERE